MCSDQGFKFGHYQYILRISYRFWDTRYTIYSMISIQYYQHFRSCQYNIADFDTMMIVQYQFCFNLYTDNGCAHTHTQIETSQCHVPILAMLYKSHICVSKIRNVHYFFSGRIIGTQFMITIKRKSLLTLRQTRQIINILKIDYPNDSRIITQKK